MDLAEASQRIAWLDEVHRADQQCLTDLQKQVDLQSATIGDLSRRLETLTVELARARGQFGRFDRLEMALAQSHDELRDRLAGEALAREAVEDKTRDRDAEHTTMLAELSRSVQALQDQVTQTQARVVQLPARVDEQVTQAGALAREVEALESRLTQAQSQAGSLDGRLSQQTEHVSQLLRQLQALEGRLSQTQSQLVRFPQIEEALTRTRAELATLVREEETRRREDLAGLTQARQHERQVDQQAFATLVRQLEVLPRLQDRVQAREAEEKRLVEALHHLEARTVELETSIDERTERLPYVEERLRREIERITALEQQATALAETIEARTARLPYVDELAARGSTRVAALERSAIVLEKAIQDKTARIPFLAELIAGNTERIDAIEPEIVEARRRDNELVEKVRFLDTWAQRIAEKIDELERFEARIDDSHEKFVEEAQFRDAARTRQMDAWAAQLDEHRQQLSAWAKELKHYAEMYDWARTTTLHIEEVSAQLVREQHEFEERVRLEVEKQKKALEDWEAEWAKQWALFLKQYEWKWNEQGKADRAHQGRTDQLEAWRQQDVARVDELVVEIKEQDKLQLQRVTDVWQIFELEGRLRQAEIKKRADEVEQARRRSLQRTTPTTKSQIQAPKVGPDPSELR